MSSEDKRAAGIELVQKLFAGTAGGAPMSEDFSRYTLEHLFGDVWQGEGLELEERSLVTCTLLVALNREAEQRLHFTGAKNLGIPRAKLEAMITHAAHYAGWPSAVGAFRSLNEVWPE
jgi:4-carboxymuconolactone decarboxylase